MMRSVRNVLFALFCAVCLLALVWPGYPLVGNRIQPLVLGLPFSLFWNVLWILLTFAALLAYHLSSGVTRIPPAEGEASPARRA